MAALEKLGLAFLNILDDICLKSTTVGVRDADGRRLIRILKLSHSS